MNEHFDDVYIRLRRAASHAPLHVSPRRILVGQPSTALGRLIPQALRWSRERPTFIVNDAAIIF